MNSDFMAKLKRGSGLDSYGSAYQFPHEKQAVAEIERLAARNDLLEDKLERVNQWCRAYPRTVFIEPTKEQWRTAAETLAAHRGDNCPSLDAISGSNMRHVVEQIQKLTENE